MTRDDATPTEIPEKLFRQSAGFREVRDIARRAAADRAEARVDAALDRASAAAGPVGAPLISLSAMLAGRRRAFVVLVALAIAAWLVAIGAGLKLGGLL